MLQSVLGRHTAEFMRAVRNGHFEATPSGFFFSKQKVHVGGVMSFDHQKGAWSRERAVWDSNHNIVVAQGREYEQAAALVGGAQLDDWYFGPYVQNIAPDDDLTATNFTSTLTEFTNYTEGTRQAWAANGTGSDEGSISNSDAPAVITIGSGAQHAIYGAGLLSVSAKSSGAGILYAAALATKPKTSLDEGDTIGMKYGIDLSSS